MMNMIVEESGTSSEEKEANTSSVGREEVTIVKDVIGVIEVGPGTAGVEAAGIRTGIAKEVDNIMAEHEEIVKVEKVK